MQPRWWARVLRCVLPFRFPCSRPPCSIRERIAHEEAVKESALIRQFLEKCAADDAREAASRQAREEARIRYMAEIASQRDERLALYEAQKVEEMRAAEDARRREEFKRRVIEEARRTMLAEHAAALVGGTARLGFESLMECVAVLCRALRCFGLGLPCGRA
jgi:hypothetical protein